MNKKFKTFFFATIMSVTCFGTIPVHADLLRIPPAQKVALPDGSHAIERTGLPLDTRPEPLPTNVITTDSQTDLNVAIYNENIALIKDTRDVDLSLGRNKIAYENISAQIIPESALLDGTNISVIEQNFDYDLITNDSLLQKSVGQDVILQTINPHTGEKERQDAKLIAFNGQPVISINGEIYTGFKGDILLKKMPEGLISKPSLSIELMSKEQGERTLGLTYLTRGLSWQADYVAEFNETEDKMNLNGFITLSNQSGTDFENANMQLVAGDVKVVQVVMPRMMRASAKAVNTMEMDLADTLTPEVEDVADFYVYTLPFKTSVQSQQTKQVSLLNASDISIKKEYVFDNTLMPYNSPRENIKATVSYLFENLKENKLGIALPKGTIRLYKEDKGGKAIFLGEKTIQHTPNTATVRLNMGEAFDIFANAKRTEYQKIGKTTTISAYEIKLKNGSNADKEVIIYQNFFNNWKISEENRPFTKETSNRVKWVVPVPANGESVLTYRVQVSNE